MTTGIMHQRDIETRIDALRKIIDFEMAAGNGDEVNRLRDEIGTCYRLLMNENEREERNKP